MRSMKLRIPQPSYKEANINMPFYYRHDLNMSTVFGRVTEGSVLTLEEHKGRRQFEIKIARQHASASVCYLKPEYSCDKQEFDNALVRAQQFVGSLETEA